MSFAALGAVASWPRMEARARGLAYEIADMHNGVTGLCCPSIAYLAMRLDSTPRTVQRLIRHLEEMGVIERHARFSGHRQTTSSYVFHRFPGEGDKSDMGDKDVTLGGDKDVTQNQEEGIRKKNQEGDVQTPLTGRSRIPYQKIVDLYHEILPELRTVEKVTAARRSQIGARWKSDLTELDHWRNYFLDVRRSKFLMGKCSPNPKTGKVFVADFNFLIAESSFVNIAEGKYHDFPLRRADRS